MTRTPLVAGNWKMHKTVAEAEAHVQVLLGLMPAVAGVEVCVCVPFTALGAAVQSTRGSPLAVFAQNMHEAPSGAFTGEVSAAMLIDLDVRGVVLGHSERRELFAETDGALARKVPAALQAGLTPILCVGETGSERERGETEEKLRRQVRVGLEHVATERLADVVIAYEPIWAIGTGLVATPDQAQETTAFLRSLVYDLWPEAGDEVRLLYGGSVKPENAAELLALPDVDGALVGGASLEPGAFAAIVGSAEA